MTSPPNDSGISSRPLSGKRNGKQKTALAIVVALLIGGYSTFRPAINQATGWNLPAIANQGDAPDGARAEATPPGGPLASKMPQDNGSLEPTGKPDATSTTQAVSNQDSSLKYGLLRELQPDRFMSPAGLLYTPGSAEGHRLKHLERHTADQPGRPGKHGVFDGGMEKTLAVLDQAYEKAKAGVRTTKSTDQGRTIYTVDMGKRVGFIGGREGNQKRKPMARRVRIVLDGNRVITAYPM